MGAFDQRGQVVGQQTNVGQGQDKHAGRQRACLELDKAIEALLQAAHGVEEDQPELAGHLYLLRNKVHEIYQRLSRTV